MAFNYATVKRIRVEHSKCKSCFWLLCGLRTIGDILRIDHITPNLAEISYLERLNDQNEPFTDMSIFGGDRESYPYFQLLSSECIPAHRDAYSGRILLGLPATEPLMARSPTPRPPSDPDASITNVLNADCIRTIFGHLDACDLNTLTGVNGRFRELAAQELDRRFARPSSYTHIPAPSDELNRWSDYARLLCKYGARLREFHSDSTSRNMNIFYGMLTAYCPNLTQLSFTCTHLAAETIKEMWLLVVKRLRSLQIDCANLKSTLAPFAGDDTELRLLRIRVMPLDRSMQDVFGRPDPVWLFSDKRVSFPCPELRTLAVEYARSALPTELRWNEFPRLDSLELSGHAAPVAKILTALIVGQCRLRALILLRCPINADVMDCLGRMSTVETLELSFNRPSVTDDVLASALWHLDKLKRVTVASNSVSMGGLLSALRMHRGIEQLHFTFNSAKRRTADRFTLTERECDDMTRTIGERKVQITLYGCPDSLEVPENHAKYEWLKVNMVEPDVDDGPPRRRLANAD